MNTLSSDDRGLIMACPHCGKRNRSVYEKLGQSIRCANCKTELAPPAVPIDIADETTFDALIGKSALPILVDFWAPWCGPCKVVAPEFVKVAAANSGKWVLAKVNTDAVQNLAVRYQISAIPTMIIFQAGKEIARQMGAMGAAEIGRFLEQKINHR